jgi:hypothetical protein
MGYKRTRIWQKQTRNCIILAVLQFSSLLSLDFELFNLQPGHYFPSSDHRLDPVIRETPPLPLIVSAHDFSLSLSLFLSFSLSLSLPFSLSLSLSLSVRVMASKLQMTQCRKYQDKFNFSIEFMLFQMKYNITYPT